MKWEKVLGYGPGERLAQALNLGVEQMKKKKVQERARLRAFVGIVQSIKELSKELNDALKVSSMDASSSANLQTLKSYIGVYEGVNLYYGSLDALLASYTLSHRANRRSGLLFDAILKSIKEKRTVQMTSICLAVTTAPKEDPHRLPDFKGLFLTEICPDIKSCTRKTTIYSNKQQYRVDLKNPDKEAKRKRAESRMSNIKVKYREADVRDACIILGSPLLRGQCNLPHAIPMMTGMLKRVINVMLSYTWELTNWDH